jgi:hypothetical protein
MMNRKKLGYLIRNVDNDNPDNFIELMNDVIDIAKAEIRAEMKERLDKLPPEFGDFRGWQNMVSDALRIRVAASPPREVAEGPAPAHKPICPRCLGGSIKCDCMITPVDYPAPAAKCQHGPNSRCLACLTLAPVTPAAEPLLFVRWANWSRYVGPFDSERAAEEHARLAGKDAEVVRLYPKPPRPEPSPPAPTAVISIPKGAEWYFVAFGPSTDNPEYFGPFLSGRAAGDYAAPSGRYYVVYRGKSPTGAAEPNPRRRAWFEAPSSEWPTEAENP